MKKVVIIGGGIGGMALGIILHKSGVQVIINEREPVVPMGGNAFLMHSDGISVLQMFLNKKEIDNIPGELIHTFILKRPDETEIKYLKLEPWQCIKRRDLIAFLCNQIDATLIKPNRTFSHFMYENEIAIAAVFQNGEIEYGDIFVGADGANSQVRFNLFGKVNFSEVSVKEIIGVVKIPTIAIKYANVFTKYLSQEKGLSFGFIPTSHEELVWFMQFDVKLLELKDSNPDTLREFCTYLLKDFPEIVHEIIGLNDFSTSYVWNATDFDLLPTFHKKNVVLIGDAAHLAMPFTSAGTTNALNDAKILAKKIISSNNYEEAFIDFYKERAEDVKEHTLLGREVAQNFLHPQKISEDELTVPLITHRQAKSKIKPKYKRIHLLYFTDPVCSTCWVIQPQLRKLKLEYGDFVEIDYCMGGLLPSWDNFQSGGIKTPEDAGEYWQRANEKYDQPIYPDIWYTDPPESSFPPSIAFKAAQMQDIDKAIIFLRRINELLFFENKNIVGNIPIHNAAFESGLDAARLMRDLEGKAQELFQEDLKLAKQLDINVLPTFIFTDRYDNSRILKGFQEYEKFENIILEMIPGVQKNLIKKNYNNLFKKYPTLTTKEFSFLIDLNLIEAENILIDLFQKNIIHKFSTNKDGIIWKLVN